MKIIYDLLFIIIKIKEDNKELRTTYTKEFDRMQHFTDTLIVKQKDDSERQRLQHREVHLRPFSYFYYHNNTETKNYLCRCSQTCLLPTEAILKLSKIR